MLRELLEERRSIRRFQDKAVEAEKIDQLIEVALRSPSSMGRNPWQFVVVTDREKIAALSQSKAHGAAFMKDAPLAIVVAADPEKCDVWIEDCSVATAVIHFAAHELGLGSCWVQIRKRVDAEGNCAEANVARLVSLPENHQVLAMVAIGYAAEEKPGHAKESLPYDHVHYEQFGNCKND